MHLKRIGIELTYVIYLYYVFWFEKLELGRVNRKLKFHGTLEVFRGYWKAIKASATLQFMAQERKQLSPEITQAKFNILQGNSKLTQNEFCRESISVNSYFITKNNYNKS